MATHAVAERAVAPIDGTVADQIREHGYAIVDNFLGHEWAAALRSELVMLETTKQLKPNQVQFSTSQGPVRFTKPRIFEADMHDASLRRQCPEFEQLFRSDALRDALDAALPELKLARGPANKVVKLQHNAGGGLPALRQPRPAQRAHSDVLDLPQPGLARGDGGELQLVPFLGARSTLSR